MRKISKETLVDIALIGFISILSFSLGAFGGHYVAHDQSSIEEKVMLTEVYISYMKNDTTFEKHHFLIKDDAFSIYNVSNAWYIILLVSFGNDYIMKGGTVLVRHSITHEVPIFEIAFYKEGSPQYWGCRISPNNVVEPCGDHMLVIKILGW